MRITSQKPGTPRRGSITPLTAIFLVLILAMVAFAVDISWMVLSESELQNAADSAALAGANKLGDNYVLFNLPTQSSVNKSTLANAAVSAAKSTAKTYAAANSAGGVSSLTLLDSDIDVGFTDAKGAFTIYSSSGSNYPNTVKVRLRRDTTANTPLSLFFAPVLGIKTADLTAYAGATLYGGTINSFKVGTTNSGIMPVTYDVNHWNNFLKTGQDADGNTTKDSNGNPILQVYPSVKSPGNFGLISLNDSHVGASTISGWIHEGVSPADIQALTTSKLIPLSGHNPALWDWQGDTGFKASNVMDLNSYVGKTFIMPLFTPLAPAPAYTAGAGKGSNYFYNVVQFVGVTVMPPKASNRDVWIQPALVSDPNAVLINVNPLGTDPTSTFATALAPAKLTN